MKRYLVMMFVLALSGLVIAAGSEISTSFNVGSPEVGRDYIPSASFWDVYGVYVVGAIIVLIVAVIYLKSRNSLVKKVKRKRRVKRRVKRRK